jgi:hypothetical protein
VEVVVAVLQHVVLVEVLVVWAVEVVVSGMTLVEVDVDVNVIVLVAST